MERLLNCVWRVGGGQKSSACTEGKIYVPRFCFLPSLQPYPWPSLLIFHSTISKLLKRRPLLKFINKKNKKTTTLNGYGVAGRGEFFFSCARLGEVFMRHSFNFPPSRSSAPASVWTLFASSFGAPCYLRVVDGRGHGWRLSSAVPCEEAACCGPRLAALMTSFTCWSLHSFATSWGPNEHGMKTALSNRPQRQERQHQRCFCALVRDTGPRVLGFFFLNITMLLPEKKTNKQTSWNDVFLTSGLLWLMRSGSASCVCGFALKSSSGGGLDSFFGVQSM